MVLLSLLLAFWLSIRISRTVSEPLETLKDVVEDLIFSTIFGICELGKVRNKFRKKDGNTTIVKFKQFMLNGNLNITELDIKTYIEDGKLHIRLPNQQIAAEIEDKPNRAIAVNQLEELFIHKLNGDESWSF